jgi:hypothetical protein
MTINVSSTTSAATSAASSATPSASNDANLDRLQKMYDQQNAYNTALEGMEMSQAEKDAAHTAIIKSIQGITG